MARHFFGLYFGILVTLAAVSWGQDKLLEIYGAEETGEERGLPVTLYALEGALRGLPPERRKPFLTELNAKTGGDVELFGPADIAGRRTLKKLGRGEIAYLESAGESWALKQLDANTVLAFKSVEAEPKRSPLEWALTLLFYAVIALVIMVWIWPLRRDLRALERAASSYGSRNWTYRADIKPGSQIQPLAETFRKMAARIDGLIASHKDMSNAVSHEIKTPLSRMQFEIELAQGATRVEEVRESLAHIKSDIQAINDLVTATLNYAILERADVTLNLGTHNFTTLVPAIADLVRRDTREGIDMRAEVDGRALQVVCDVHLLETALKNLLYNAARHARREVRVTFDTRGGVNRLTVEDDGPGIPEADRERVFESFVQLGHGGAEKTGFGLGLAIVKRAIEWHNGEVGISQSPLGGACIAATWPVIESPRAPAAAFQ